MNFTTKSGAIYDVKLEDGVIKTRKENYKFSVGTIFINSKDNLVVRDAIYNFQPVLIFREGKYFAGNLVNDNEFVLKGEVFPEILPCLEHHALDIQQLNETPHGTILSGLSISSKIEKIS